MTPRILEIGRQCVFKRVYPESAMWLCPGAPYLAAAHAASAPPFVSGAAVPEIRQRLLDGDYDLVVYIVPGLPPHAATGFSLRRAIHRLKERRSLLRKTASALLRESANTPLAVLDMDDAEPISPANLPLLDRCRAYFKRELPADPARLFPSPATPSLDPRSMETRLARVRPISLGLPMDRLMSAPAGPSEKTVDVFFAGSVAKRPVRKQGLVCLRSLAANEIVVDLAGGLSLREYLERCARAWLVWSPEGLGRDCFRHYEAPLCRSVPVINRAQAVRHRPLIDGTHCFYYDAEGDDLARVILDALNDKARLTRMAHAARAHVLEHHTHEALCHYVLNEVLY